jgi:ATP-dependent helicase/nuclease subunit B
VDPDDLARESLARHQFSSRSFSATALQNYASCPYRFFLSAILRLELRQEPAAIEVIDPLTRGSLFHETQFQVLTALKASGHLPLGPKSLAHAFDLVDGSLERLAADYEDRLAPAIPRVWQDGVNSIKADLREWLRRMSESDDGWVPDRFELSFGLSDRGPRASDPSSVEDPVEIIGKLKLRGSIDLVEHHASGKYRVTDHKTGKARAPKDTIVGAGKYLQPLLYAATAQKLLKQYVESGRLYYCTAAGGYEERVVPLSKENLMVLDAVLSAVRSALTEAFLPAAPEEGACQWCDFLALCGGFEEARTRHKPNDRLIQLKGIRVLP